MGFEIKLKYKEKDKLKIKKLCKNIDFLKPIIEENELLFYFNGDYKREDYYASIVFLEYIAINHGEYEISPFTNKKTNYLLAEDMVIFISEENNISDKEIKWNELTASEKSSKNIFQKEKISITQKILKSSHGFSRNKGIDMIKKALNI